VQFNFQQSLYLASFKFMLIDLDPCDCRLAVEMYFFVLINSLSNFNFILIHLFLNFLNLILFAYLLIHGDVNGIRHEQLEYELFLLLLFEFLLLEQHLFQLVLLWIYLFQILFLLLHQFLTLMEEFSWHLIIYHEDVVVYLRKETFMIIQNYLHYPR